MEHNSAVRKSAAPTTPQANFSEVGRSGLRQWGGYVYEEFIKELYGIRGVKIYKEMAENDSVVGAVLFAIEMLLRQATWSVKPASSASADLASAEFVESCLHDMSHTWSETISEILTMLPYGWSYHEIVYKRRLGPSRNPMTNSKYSDGLIGWRKLPIRSQDTLLHWQFDDDTGELQAMVQTPPPDYQQRIIPIEKALLFRTRTNKDNPEGHSILRNAYRAWHFKKRIEVIEGIGVERDLAGLPVIKPLPDYDVDIFNAQDPAMVQLRNELEKTVRNIRRDELEGVVLPQGWDLELLASAGSRQLDVGSIIQRYDQRIAMTVLSDFILLGSEQVGSYALATSKSDIFMQALNVYLDTICDVFNTHAIPRLIALNPGLPQENLPQLQHGKIDAPNLQEIGEFMKNTAPYWTPGNPEIESWLARMVSAPDPNANGSDDL